MFTCPFESVRPSVRPSAVAPLQGLSRGAAWSNALGGARRGLRRSCHSSGRGAAVVARRSLLILRMSDVPQNFTRGHAFPHPLTIPSTTLPDSVASVRPSSIRERGVLNRLEGGGNIVLPCYGARVTRLFCMYALLFPRSGFLEVESFQFATRLASSPLAFYQRARSASLVLGKSSQWWQIEARKT